MDKGRIEDTTKFFPSLNKRSHLLLLYVLQFSLFLVIIYVLWFASSIHSLGAIIGQSTLSFILSIHFIYIANNANQIREKYKRAYGELAAQKFWLRYISPTLPAVSASFYFPLLLLSYNNKPIFILSSDNILFKNIFPHVLSLPFGVFMIVVGFLIRRPSGGYSFIEDDYLCIVYPEKSKLITTGLYQYVRNPQYLGRGMMSIGFGIISNNLNAVIAGIIHFLSYCAIIYAEDRELSERFGEDFDLYKENVPAIFPEPKKILVFLKHLFSRKQITINNYTSERDQ